MPTAALEPDPRSRSEQAGCPLPTETRQDVRFSYSSGEPVGSNDRGAGFDGADAGDRATRSERFHIPAHLNAVDSREPHQRQWAAVCVVARIVQNGDRRLPSGDSTMMFIERPTKLFPSIVIWSTTASLPSQERKRSRPVRTYCPET